MAEVRCPLCGSDDRERRQFVTAKQLREHGIEPKPGGKNRLCPDPWHNQRAREERCPICESADEPGLVGVHRLSDGKKFGAIRCWHYFHTLTPPEGPSDTEPERCGFYGEDDVFCMRPMGHEGPCSPTLTADDERGILGLTDTDPSSEGECNCGQRHTVVDGNDGHAVTCPAKRHPHPPQPPPDDGAGEEERWADPYGANPLHRFSPGPDVEGGMEPDRYGGWVHFAEYNEKILDLESRLSTLTQEPSATGPRYETTVHDRRTGQPVKGCEGDAIGERWEKRCGEAMGSGYCALTRGHSGSHATTLQVELERTRDERDESERSVNARIAELESLASTLTQERDEARRQVEAAPWKASYEWMRNQRDEAEARLHTVEARLHETEVALDQEVRFREDAEQEAQTLRSNLDDNERELSRAEAELAKAKRVAAEYIESNTENFKAREAAEDQADEWRLESSTQWTRAEAAEQEAQRLRDLLKQIGLLVELRDDDAQAVRAIQAELRTLQPSEPVQEDE